MPLQIKPFKAPKRAVLPELNRPTIYQTQRVAPNRASRRKILPALNEPHYTEKSRLRTAQGRRSALKYSSLARKIASQKTQRQIQTDIYGRTVGEYSKGTKLKDGIMKMATMAEDVTDEQLYLLNQMDPEKLDAMYKNNDLIFEVYFQYGANEDGMLTLNNKNRDVQFLIDQYQKIYGTIA